MSTASTQLGSLPTAMWAFAPFGPISHFTFPAWHKDIQITCQCHVSYLYQIIKSCFSLVKKPRKSWRSQKSWHAWFVPISSCQTWATKSYTTWRESKLLSPRVNHSMVIWWYVKLLWFDYDRGDCGDCGDCEEMGRETREKHEMAPILALDHLDHLDHLDLICRVHDYHDCSADFNRLSVSRIFSQLHICFSPLVGFPKVTAGHIDLGASRRGHMKCEECDRNVIGMWKMCLKETHEKIWEKADVQHPQVL